MKPKSPIRTSRILIAIFFYGSVVGFTSGDKENGEKTWIDFAGGIGSFTRIVKDCNGNITSHDEFPFTDAGVSATHNFPNSVMSLTGKIGTFSITRNQILVPADSLRTTPVKDHALSAYGGIALGIHSPFFGLDLGFLYFENIEGNYLINTQLIPYGTLRIGYENKWYFSASFLNNNPLLSDGGILEMGLGFQLAESKSSLWLGVGLGQSYVVQENISTFLTLDGASGLLIGRATIVPEGWNAALLFSGKIGLNSDAPEYGFSVGLRLNFQ